MLAQSFRFVAVRLPHRGGVLLRVVGGALVLTVAIIVAGCGSSAKPKAQIIAGTGFRFSAPAGWTVQRRVAALTATQGDQFVRVSTFPLGKAYRPQLFAKLGAELKVRMTALAKQTGGAIQGTAVATAAGIRAHVWSVKTGGSLDEYTFVLRGRREYQLLCHRSSSDDDAVCAQLVSTFQLT